MQPERTVARPRADTPRCKLTEIFHRIFRFAVLTLETNRRRRRRHFSAERIGRRTLHVVASATSIRENRRKRTRNRSSVAIFP